MFSDIKRPVQLTCVDTVDQRDATARLFPGTFSYVRRIGDDGYWIVNSENWADAICVLADRFSSPNSEDIYRAIPICRQNAASLLLPKNGQCDGFISAARRITHTVALTNTYNGKLVVDTMKFLLLSAAKRTYAATDLITLNDCVASHCKHPLFAASRTARAVLPLNCDC